MAATLEAEDIPDEEYSDGPLEGVKLDLLTPTNGAHEDSNASISDQHPSQELVSEVLDDPTDVSITSPNISPPGHNSPTLEDEQHLDDSPVPKEEHESVASVVNQEDLRDQDGPATDSNGVVGTGDDIEDIVNLLETARISKPRPDSISSVPNPDDVQEIPDIDIE